MLQVSTEVQSSLALFDRIFEYLDLEHEIEDAPDAVALALDRDPGEIELDHVGSATRLRPKMRDRPSRPPM